MQKENTMAILTYAPALLAAPAALIVAPATADDRQKTQSTMQQTAGGTLSPDALLPENYDNTNFRDLVSTIKPGRKEMKVSKKRILR
jgi:hypothetical protein